MPISHNGDEASLAPKTSLKPQSVSRVDYMCKAPNSTTSNSGQHAVPQVLGKVKPSKARRTAPLPPTLNQDYKKKNLNTKQETLDKDTEIFKRYAPASKHINN